MGMLYEFEGETFEEMTERLQQEIKDLKDELADMTEQKDIQYDRAEKAYEALNALENGEEVELSGYEHLVAIDRDRLETFEKSEETLSEVEGIINEINEAYSRVNMGVLSDIDTIIQLTNELLEKDL